jgi:hypothetical protein
MHVQVTSYNCPACGKSFKSRVVNSPRATPAYRVCKCGAKHLTPNLQWSSMKKNQKMEYFLSVWLVGWLLVFGSVAGLAVWSGDFVSALMILGGGVICCLPSWLLKWMRVKYSVSRTSTYLGF